MPAVDFFGTNRFSRIPGALVLTTRITYGFQRTARVWPIDMAAGTVTFLA
jgi:hypothetical protein